VEQTIERWVAAYAAIVRCQRVGLVIVDPAHPQASPFDEVLCGLANEDGVLLENNCSSFYKVE
jgi:hypothetical protein